LKSEEAFLDDLLASKEGNEASELAAVRVAVECGMPLTDAVKYLVSSPELKAAILLEALSRQEFV
jgi:hypothetical protein